MVAAALYCIPCHIRADLVSGRFRTPELEFRATGVLHMDGLGILVVGLAVSAAAGIAFRRRFALESRVAAGLLASGLYIGWAVLSLLVGWAVGQGPRKRQRSMLRLAAPRCARALTGTCDATPVAADAPAPGRTSSATASRTMISLSRKLPCEGIEMIRG